MRGVILAGAAMALLLASCTPPQQAREEPQEPELPLDYVALGDSYAALGSRGGEEPCLRSADNYPANVLRHPDVVGTDLSCSGGQIPDLALAGLGEGTDLVTLSIGGNDIGYGAIVDCFVDELAGGQRDCAGELEASTSATLAQLPGELDAAHAEIRARAPEAQVVVTGYLPLLTEEDSCVPVSARDQQWVVGVIEDLNAIVAEAAERADAEFVLPDGSGHSGCAAPEERWVDFFGVETDAYPMHPTPLGQRVMADAVLAVSPVPPTASLPSRP